MPRRSSLHRRSITFACLTSAIALSTLPARGWAQSAADSVAPKAIDSLAVRRAELARVRITSPRARPVVGYLTSRSRSATKTDTPLLNVPQSISVVTHELMRDQSMQGMSDVARYLPGISISQGEGNRDALVLRGNTSTSDFFLDGVRDDAQYFRDLYNIDRIEALKGANAMTFGRGGVGGVINRVTKHADWSHPREITLQSGSWNNRRLVADLGQGLGNRAAVRVTGMLEDSDTYRTAVGLRRAGVNPTLALALGERATVRFGYEYFTDNRTADRGIPSYQGRPLRTDAKSFFGDPALSESNATVRHLTASADYAWSPSLALQSHTSYSDYDKFYQNVFSGAVAGDGATFNVSAYNAAAQRQNLFHQTNLTGVARTGWMTHTVLVGLELARQTSENVRTSGYFNGTSTTASARVNAPQVSIPLTFRPSATDANNAGTAYLASLYVQDQVEFAPWLYGIIGLRVDRFAMDVENRRTGATLTSLDAPLSPRVGLIYKPRAATSLYASYSRSYLPRAGEQLASLSLSNATLDPEAFRNYEVGAKWDATPYLSLTAAGYRLARRNIAIADPADVTRFQLVDGQETKGVELGVSGRLSSRWSVMGGYSLSDGRITKNLSAAARSGARLPLLPRHVVSLWNRVDLSSQWGIGIGTMYESEEFTSTDNSVTLPGFARFDGALFYAPTQHLRMQVNVENLLDTAYFPSATNNNNITPGAPRHVRLSVTVRD